MTSWIATAYGALDLRTWHENQSDIDIMLLPVKHSEPIGLAGPYSQFWLRLVDSPVSEEDLSINEHQLIREYEAAGIASRDYSHPARITGVEPPWLRSPLHELVYSLLASVARDNGVRIVLIKGPMLHAQGLRDKEHSGDVDAWVDPEDQMRMTRLMEKWGWVYAPGLWGDSPAYHSLTLRPDGWGCEIDLHRHMPGCATSDASAFEALFSNSIEQSFAGVSVHVPTTEAHAVILALHLLRPQRRNPAPGNHEPVQRAFRRAGIGALRFSDKIQASAVLHKDLSEAFPESTVVADYEPPLNWKWREETNQFKKYLIALKMVPPVQRLRVLMRILWPEAQTAIRFDRNRGGTAQTALSARAQRLKRGLLRQLRNRSNP